MNQAAAEKTSGKVLYEGKAKRVIEHEDPERCIVEFTDRVTAGNGERLEEFIGKGAVTAQISALLMRHLSAGGVATHLINEVSPERHEAWRVEIIPLEVIVRNVAAGSMARNYGVKEGLALKHPTVEFSLKDDDLGDPLIAASHVTALGLVEQPTLSDVSNTALKVNSILRDVFGSIGFELIDFKLEFGVRGDGAIVVADEISPDTCRIWGLDKNSSGESFDKDIFRREGSNIVPAYMQVLERLRDVPVNQSGSEQAHVTAHTWRIKVMPKKGVLDPQGRATSAALRSMGFDEVSEVRVGKSVELTTLGDHVDPAKQNLRLATMVEKLIANPVIEDWAIDDAEVLR